MNADQIRRSDFPADGTGYDRASVDAHLVAVAAWAAALEAQITALEVERDALRRQPFPPQRPEDRVASQPEPEGPGPGTTPEAAIAEVPDKPGATRSDDEVSARLVATRLALEGVEREQIREKLESTYDLEDADSLIDDVLERLA